MEKSQSDNKYSAIVYYRYLIRSSTYGYATEWGIAMLNSTINGAKRAFSQIVIIFMLE
jgi:hypothetical protein